MPGDPALRPPGDAVLPPSDLLGCGVDYGAGTFERADFERLGNQLAAIAGRFLLSINATSGAREVFGRFAIKEVETTYTVGTPASGGKRARELIVTSPS